MGTAWIEVDNQPPMTENQFIKGNEQDFLDHPETFADHAPSVAEALLVGEILPQAAAPSGGPQTLKRRKGGR
ncbi:MAG: hypothetical protein H7Z41_02965 [Cytophagales bacterium]|nr:hypothetical protein [Armatimonadota bacterium]